MPLTAARNNSRKGKNCPWSYFVHVYINARHLGFHRTYLNWRTLLQCLVAELGNAGIYAHCTLRMELKKPGGSLALLAAVEVKNKNRIAAQEHYSL